MYRLHTCNVHVIRVFIYIDYGEMNVMKFSVKKSIEGEK